MSSVGEFVLVVPEKKTLIIDSSHNDSVQKFIPHAKELNHDGKSMVAVPFGPIEAMVLRNMGFSVPDPIKQYYGWPARFKRWITRSILRRFSRLINVRYA